MEINDSTETQGLDNGSEDKTQESGNQSVRSAIEAAYDKIEKENSEKDKEVKSKNKLPAPDQDPILKSGREGVETKEEASSSDEAKKGESQPSESTEEKESIKAPVSWSRKDREVFKSLDKGAQEIIARRESERDKVIQKATTERAEIEKAVKPFLDISEKVKSVARAAKIKPTEFIDALVETDAQARKNPVDFIERFAKANGVDLKTLSEGDKETAWDRAMHQASSELQMLRAEVEALREEKQGAYTRQQEIGIQQQLAPGQAAVLSFFQGEKLQDLESDPHLIDRVTMEAEIIRRNDPGASPEEVLQEAYSNAVYASPKLRQAYLQRQAHAQQEQRRQELESAKRRQGLRSSAPGVSGTKKFDSLRSQLESIYDDLAQR
jgi:hypothetical protein